MQCRRVSAHGILVDMADICPWLIYLMVEALGAAGAYQGLGTCE
jgi:hypothetical protein